MTLPAGERGSPLARRALIGKDAEMGWLDANEYVLLEAAARDRLDEVRRVDDGRPRLIDEDAEDEGAGRRAPYDHARRVLARPPASCDPRHRHGLTAELAMMLLHFHDGRSRETARVLEDVLRASRDGLTLVNVNVDRRPTLAAWYAVRSLPTVLFVRDGEVVDRVIGQPSRALLESMLAARAPRPRAA